MTTNSGQEHAGEGVKRYCIHYDARGEYEHPKGDFVHWPDYQAVIAALEKLTRERDEARAHTPHFYSPSVMHMGDCSICGCEQDSPNHHTDWDRPAAHARIAALEAENAKMREEKRAAHQNFVTAWEALPGDREYSLYEVQRWLINTMKPAVDRARAILGEQP